ncbi:MvaI/BcnI family restriction endonuclease [Salinibacterium sp. ZJ450]|uniref:MvaI/BcnI family restriction endonuclease n=1 Tax=Salinibacterium sp. ZJ450 TaxID=2708338 RepID=UPI0014248446|nr:MvaI/BcnI family restriction endonuclease [Salinibacterium sp. ZJ450]
MRLLSQTEVDRLSLLTKAGVPISLLEPTQTALGKSIIDAVEDFRRFLSEQGVHDYETQPQGQDNKKVVPALLLTEEDRFVRADASLYRPRTKTGDPRVWFSRLKNHVRGGDIIAVAYSGGQLFIFDISRLDLERTQARGGAFATFLAPFLQRKVSAVEELLGAMVAVAAKGFIRSIGSADTTVGMLLEAELGIKANSSKAPDYRGIEIKGARGNRSNRHNLFARVPDWSVSPLKSSQAVLDEFGYIKDGRKQLYCTVSTGRPNGQGLFLAVEEAEGLLWERSVNSSREKVVAWPISGLEESLRMKHAETFWVTAESRRLGADEEFRFHRVEHTANPILEQLVPLVRTRHITMDHLVREKNGRAAERGPLFKLKHGSLGLLFPPSTVYDLSSGAHSLKP